MNAKLEKISQLRQLLRSEFGNGQNFASTSGNDSSRIEDELAPWETCEKGTLSEVIAEPGRPGLGWFLEGLLHSPVAAEGVALVDGRDCFDPEEVPPEDTTPFLWVRCRGAGEAVQAADWLARDGNLPRIILDLQYNSVAELRRVPASSWYRLKALAEKTGSVLIVFSPAKLLPCASRRLRFHRFLPISALDEPREQIVLAPQVEKTRTNPSPSNANAVVESAF